MKTSLWLQAFAVAALLATGCASTGAPTGGATTSPTGPGSSAEPTPTPYLALVTLRGSSSYVVRDLTDIAHPNTVGNLGGVSSPVFVSGSEVSYSVPGSTYDSLYRAPLTGSPKTLVTNAGGAGTWSPNGNAVLFTTSVSPEKRTVHQLRVGADQILGSVPGGGMGGCSTIASCQIPNFLDFRLLYSPDGNVISLVTTGFGMSAFRLWSADGKLLTSSDAQGLTFSEWSGTGLYFRDGGVKVWRDGVVSPFLQGVAWVKPRASPTGGQIVYTARGAGGWSHIFLVDTTSGKVRELKSARTDAVFLTSRHIWYEGERACVTADICGSAPAGHPLSGKTYIYDLQTGIETESIITGVADVWPHAA